MRRVTLRHNYLTPVQLNLNGINRFTQSRKAAKKERNSFKLLASVFFPFFTLRLRGFA